MTVRDLLDLLKALPLDREISVCNAGKDYDFAAGEILPIEGLTPSGKLMIDTDYQVRQVAKGE